MANVLPDDKKQQVLALGRLGWPVRRIEEATGVRRETASGYLKAAGIAVRAPRARDLPAKPASEVSTDPAGGPNPASVVSTDSASAALWARPPERSPAASACEPYRELVEQGLRLGRNAMAIWQDLVSDQGFGHGYASVRRFVGKLRRDEPDEPCAVIETKPGEEAQVDYGTGPMVRDLHTGKYHRTRLFVMTLGYSRKAVRLLSFRSSSRIWSQLHETAFRRLGGAVGVVVLDNLKEGVNTPDIYDPVLNPLYRDMLTHYGAVALACRVRDPDRKGKVESGVGHAKKTPLKGLRFESLDEAQAYLDRWEERWADTRIHGTTKRQVAALFAEEKPYLKPLPIEPFRYYQYGKRTVHLDGCVEIARAYYRAVPPAHIGQEVGVQWDERTVRILDTEWHLLREHRPQLPGGYRIDEDEKRRTPKTTQQLLVRAACAGRYVGAVCAAIHREDGEMGIRRVQGMLALARRHGRVVVDDACRVALDVGVPSYRFVRRYLEHRPQLHLTLRQVDPLIRDLTHYRDLIRRKTGEAP
jgi:transposase